MRIRLALFVLLLIGAMQAPGQVCPPPNPLPNPLPPDPMLPMPLNCTRPETGLSFLGGAWNGICWRFGDGSDVELCRGIRGIPHVIRRHPLRETETFRSTLVIGTHAGVDSEWYLGNGFSARHDLGVMPLVGGSFPFLSRVQLAWYPYEGVLLTAGYDLFSGWLARWEFRP